MNTVRFEVCNDNALRPSAVACRAGVVAVAMVDRSTMETGLDVGGRWHVSVAHTGGTAAVGQLVRVVSSVEEKGFCHPMSLSISEDRVLAVSLGRAGVLLYAVYPEMPPVAKLSVRSLGRVWVAGECAEAVRWTGPSNIPDSLVLWTKGTARDSVKISGNIDRTLRQTVLPQEVLSVSLGSLLAFEASTPGQLAVVVRQQADLRLYMLLRGVDRMYCVQSIDLMASVRPEAPQIKTVKSVAISERLVAVGFMCAPFKDSSEPSGIVEVFDRTSLKLYARRLLTDTVPTALVTSGARVLVGASSPPLLVSGFSRPIANLYLLSVDRAAASTVCAGDRAHPHWVQGTLWMDMRSWCYVRCVTEEDGNVTTVVECAELAAR